MARKEQFIGAFDSIFLSLVLAWGLVIGVELVHPQTEPEPHGVVEIYSLASVSDAPAGA